MKALVATKETQGRRTNDFCHCVEGEYVTYGFECDRETVDGVCGCKRSLLGFDSSKATTTFRVATADLTENRLRELLRDKLTREGWISDRFTKQENEKFLGDNFEDTVRLWSSFGRITDGMIVERRGDRFNMRRPAVH